MATQAPPKGQTASADQFSRLPVGAKAGLLVGIVLAICAIYYFVFHRSVVADIEAADNRRVQLEEEREEARERNAEYTRLRDELTRRQTLDESNRRALPESAETAALIDDLYQQAAVSGVVIMRLEPRPEEPEEHYVRLPVTLRLQGRYHQLARFFHNVSRLERLISMENISLSEPEQNVDQVLLQVEALATTYRRPGEDDETDADEEGDS